MPLCIFIIMAIPIASAYQPQIITHIMQSITRDNSRYTGYVASQTAALENFLLITKRHYQDHIEQQKTYLEEKKHGCLSKNIMIYHDENTYYALIHHPTLTLMLNTADGSATEKVVYPLSINPRIKTLTEQYSNTCTTLFIQKLIAPYQSVDNRIHRPFLKNILRILEEKSHNRFTHSILTSIKDPLEMEIYKRGTLLENAKHFLINNPDKVVAIISASLALSL